ncbi:MAG: hypothetical protein R3D66_06340 [Alphaproteobacteria bacterium]
MSDPAPFAVVTKQGGSVSCLVQRLSEDYDEKEEIAVHISGIPLSRLKPVPGTNELWQSAVGIHEGAHCGHAHEGTLLTHQVLKHEIEADQETVNWLRESGLHDMAQALVDYRILAAVFKGNISHVSSLFITENREPHILEEKHIIDVINLKTKIVDAVVAESGMKRFDVWDGLGFELEFKPEDEEQLVNETGFIENQNKILDTLEALLKRGAFDDTAHYSPHMKALIETFLGACNRQIEGRTVKPGMDYGRIAPVNDKPAIQAGDGAPVRSSDGAPVRVGGHSDLSGIFGAVADPNAPNRILVEHKHEHGSNVEGAAPGLKAPMH